MDVGVRFRQHGQEVGQNSSPIAIVLYVFTI
jgi:hypothetical protein